MKIYLAIIAAASLAVPWSHGQEVVDGYSILKVCQEDLVLHTSDGSEGGRIGYVVVDPGSQRIVSALVTGGVLAERVVAVPFRSMRFKSAREVTLIDIDQQRLISAPVIERTVLTSTTTRFEPSVIERSYTYFGGNAAELRVGYRSDTTTSRTDIERDRDGRNRDGRGPDRDRNRPDATDPSRTDRADVQASGESRRMDRNASSEAKKDEPEGRKAAESRTAEEGRRGNKQPDSTADRRGAAKSPDSPPSSDASKKSDSSSSSGSANRPDASGEAKKNGENKGEANKSSRPGEANANKPSDERPAASTPGNSDANPSANNNSSSTKGNKKDDQAKESPTEKKTPGADSTDPANRRPDRDNPENKGAAQKAGESATPGKADKTPSPDGGSGESIKKPL
ncbi:MAG TPA: hypothetical protein VLE43_21465 [Candidatus Saccharimonadia bacterium]|nr:hypothetical protein [Candidatus Saccharimonadia bacterium]